MRRDPIAREVNPCRIDRAGVHWGHMPVNVRFSSGRVERFPFVIVRLRAGATEGIGEALVPPNAFLERLLPMNRQ